MLAAPNDGEDDDADRIEQKQPYDEREGTGRQAHAARIKRIVEGDADRGRHGPAQRGCIRMRRRPVPRGGNANTMRAAVATTGQGGARLLADQAVQ